MPDVDHSADSLEPEERSRRRIDWRRFTVWTLIVVASLLVIVVEEAVFVKRQALNADNFASSSAKLLNEPRVRTTLSTYLVDQLYQNVDVVGDLQRALPKQLKGLAPPAAAALREYAQRAAYAVLGTQAVNTAFREAAARAHAAFLKIVDRDPGRAQRVYLQLRPVVLKVASRMGLEKQAASALPEDAGQLKLFNENQINTIRTGINVLRTVSVFLAILIVALYSLAILLARGWRREALIRSGFGLLIAGVVVLVLRKLTETVLLDAVVGSRPSRPAVAASYRILTDLLGVVAWTAVAIGLLAIVLGLLAGPSRPARAVRGWFAPGLVRHPVIAWGIVAFLVLLLFLLVPITDYNKLISRIVVIALLAGGTEMLRRVTKREHPDGGWTFDSVHFRRRPPYEPASNHSSRYDELGQVSKLRREGLLTDEEAEREKARILER